jgi:general secretion pathway protein I
MAAPSPRRTDRRGFTLIEVLVAFAVAAVLLVGLSRAFSGGFRLGGEVDRYDAALVIAESTIDALGAALPPRDDGAFDRREGGFAVRAVAHRYGEDEATPGTVEPVLVPYELAVAVSWQEGRQRRSVELQTLRLAPPR